MSDFGKKLLALAVVSLVMFGVFAAVTWIKVNKYDLGEVTQNAMQALLAGLAIVVANAARSVFLSIAVAFVLCCSVVSASDADYKCQRCGWTPFDAGPMNSSGTWEPLVGATRIDLHNYDCGRECASAVVKVKSRSRVVEVAGLFDRLVRRTSATTCVNGKCGIKSVKPLPAKPSGTKPIAPKG